MRAKATRVVRLYFASRLVFVCIVLSPLSGFPVDRSRVRVRTRVLRSYDFPLQPRALQRQRHRARRCNRRRARSRAHIRSGAFWDGDGWRPRCRASGRW